MKHLKYLALLLTAGVFLASCEGLPGAGGDSGGSGSDLAPDSVDGKTYTLTRSSTESMAVNFLTSSQVSLTSSESNDATKNCSYTYVKNDNTGTVTFSDCDYQTLVMEFTSSGKGNFTITADDETVSGEFEDDDPSSHEENTDGNPINGGDPNNDNQDSAQFHFGASIVVNTGETTTIDKSSKSKPIYSIVFQGDGNNITLATGNLVRQVEIASSNNTFTVSSGADIEILFFSPGSSNNTVNYAGSGSNSAYFVLDEGENNTFPAHQGGPPTQ